jgi:hypothetical protein
MAYIDTVLATGPQVGLRDACRSLSSRFDVRATDLQCGPELGSVVVMLRPCASAALYQSLIFGDITEARSRPHIGVGQRRSIFDVSLQKVFDFDKGSEVLLTLAVRWKRHSTALGAEMAERQKRHPLQLPASLPQRQRHKMKCCVVCQPEHFTAVAIKMPMYYYLSEIGKCRIQSGAVNNIRCQQLAFKG